MADLYVWSGGSNTSPYDTWVKAANSATTALSDVITASAAGDRIFINSGATISQAVQVTYTFKGTPAAPTQIFSVNTTTNVPPVAADLLPGANISTTLASPMILGGTLYAYGLLFSAGNATNIAGISIVSITNVTSSVTLDSCTLKLNNTATTSTITLGTSNPLNAAEITLANTTMSFGNVSQGVVMRDRTIWRDTASAIGGTAPTTLFQSFAFPGPIHMTGVDLSALGSGHTIVGNGNASSNVVMVNCKLGASVTVAATPLAQGGVQTDLIVSDSGATGYRQERYWYAGTLTTSSAISNNASDSVQAISWNVTTTANSSRAFPFECFEIIQWVAAGAYGNSTIALTSATANLTNADVWCDAQIMTSGAAPVTTLTSSAPATPLTAGSNLANGTWATGGLAANVTIAIPSFTVAIPGYQRFTVKVAKATTTVFVDPAVTVAA